VVFDQVKVPVGNLLGQHNQGPALFASRDANAANRVQMHHAQLQPRGQSNQLSFLHPLLRQRWFIGCICVAGIRRVTTEVLKWAMQRRVFGAPLMEQPVVRAKVCGQCSVLCLASFSCTTPI
jgi:alkylation response protein AidB-like acyl-CoA dehydrogenase